MQSYDVIIIGAGAAGLMCAGTAASRGRAVLLVDHADKVGKKILISGGGRCNFTNHYTSAEHFISQNPHFCKGALARFSAADFLDRVEAHGIAWHERDHGQLFCDHSAADILDMLLAPCREHGVRILLQTEVQSIVKENGFQLATSQGEFSCSSLVIASGGLSIPKMGATGFGIVIARQFGLNVVTQEAGLVPLRFTGHEQEALQSLAGISLQVGIRCGRKSFTEALLFTHRGISGPAVLQISSYWHPGEMLDINLLPGLDLTEWLARQTREHPNMRLDNALASLLPKRLVQLLVPWLKFPLLPLQKLSDKQRQRVTDQITHWQLKPATSEGYRTAEVTVGGVDTCELSSKTMQATRVPGLYFIGEVVDVTGHLGGFNFQWAWSSGYAAGLDV
ncbi:MAG TPA: NAD(P)/FAD-dependent oxidoreductase [Mariprofundaceae bacterium]|nr:NAD(P)/FAD-dependent oxidoreductase [Mariprofundaceae bacterium]